MAAACAGSSFFRFGVAIRVALGSLRSKCEMVDLYEKIGCCILGIFTKIRTGRQEVEKWLLS